MRLFSNNRQNPSGSKTKETPKGYPEKAQLQIIPFGDDEVPRLPRFQVLIDRLRARIVVFIAVDLQIIPRIATSWRQDDVGETDRTVGELFV